MNNRSLTIFIFGAVLLMVVGYALLLVLATWPIDTMSIEKAGVFGDSFGIVNALFSGLAFGGVIITILLQRNELALQREELKATRKEMENQGRIQERQAFESTFFHLLKHQNDLLNGIEIIDSSTSVAFAGKEVKGRNSITVFVKRLEKNYRSYDNTENDEERALKAFKTFWERYSSELAHYTGNFCSILGFIDSGEQPYPHIYSHILRSQLSNQELILLFYYALFHAKIEQKDYLKRLIESHGIFGEMDESLVFDISHKNLYGKDAYGFGYSPSRN